MCPARAVLDCSLRSRGSRVEAAAFLAHSRTKKACPLARSSRTAARDPGRSGPPPSSLAEENYASARSFSVRRCAIPDARRAVTQFARRQSTSAMTRPARSCAKRSSSARRSWTRRSSRRSWPGALPARPSQARSSSRIVPVDRRGVHVHDLARLPSRARSTGRTGDRDVA